MAHVAKPRTGGNDSLVEHIRPRLDRPVSPDVELRGVNVLANVDEGRDVTVTPVAKFGCIGLPSFKFIGPSGIQPSTLLGLLVLLELAGLGDAGLLGFVP